MDVVDQVVSDINTVARIFAGTAAGFLENAGVRLAEACVFRKGHDREMVNDPGATKLA
jgi:hypothetical protein